MKLRDAIKLYRGATEDQYYEAYKRIYCQAPLRCSYGFDIHFEAIESRFRHAFYESQANSQRRDKKDRLSKQRAILIRAVGYTLCSSDAKYYYPLDKDGKTILRHKIIVALEFEDEVYLVVIRLGGDGKWYYLTSYPTRKSKVKNYIPIESLEGGP